MGHPGGNDAGGKPDPKDPDQGDDDAVPDSELTARAPVTRDRVEGCSTSARYWARALPHYADKEQRWADVCSLLAGVISAITSLAIWPLVTGVADNKVDSVTVGAIVFSGFALAAAIVALLPRVFNFGEMAGGARELATRYGSMVGELRDLLGEPEFDPFAARPIVDEFEKTKAKKDALRRLPNRDEDEAKWARDRATRSQAEAAAAEAELKAVQARNALARAQAEKPPEPAT